MLKSGASHGREGGKNGEFLITFLEVNWEIPHKGLRPSEKNKLLLSKLIFLSYVVLGNRILIRADPDLNRKSCFGNIQ